MAVAERFQGANAIDAGRLSPYWGEHTARYVFALPYVEGRSVLDIACGTGYGLKILSRSARLVTGADVNMEAAREAKRECGDGKAVVLGNGLALPFPDECFEAVTSFETLEHLHRRREFLAELRRVLKPDGNLILSTPNAIYTKPVNGKPANPFHIFEYKPGELLLELESNFRVNELLGQSLNPAIQIPPFHDAQVRLPADIKTQAKLFGWKVLNKLPFALRESVSDAVWRKPFYPTSDDYLFSSESVETAPVLVAVCARK